MKMMRNMISETFRGTKIGQRSRIIGISCIYAQAGKALAWSTVVTASPQLICLK